MKKNVRGKAGVVVKKESERKNEEGVIVQKECMREREKECEREGGCESYINREGQKVIQRIKERESRRIKRERY